MTKAVKTQTLKRFRKRVEYHITVIEDSIGFLSDSEWIALVLAKCEELAETEQVDIDELARLGALIEIWGTNREI